jgi:tetratricopeptide (TPR) repeat protein
MSFFRKKLDPFSSFTIKLGPLYVERVFDSLLTLEGVKEVVRMPSRERFEYYLQYLRKKVDLGDPQRYTLIQFYKAHFCQQLAKHCDNAETTIHFLERSLCYYQNYLELTGRRDESTYYAQWQAGLLQDNLHYSWPMVEESLLKACALDPLRGEPLKRLVNHYMRTREWKTAYTYSVIALKDHFDRTPAASRRWFIEFDAYDWNVVHKHLTICYKLGYGDEAAQNYERMLDYEAQHPDEFKTSDIRHIHSLEKIFHRSDRRLATAS